VVVDIPDNVDTYGADTDTWDILLAYEGVASHTAHLHTLGEEGKEGQYHHRVVVGIPVDNNLQEHDLLNEDI